MLSLAKLSRWLEKSIGICFRLSCYDRRVTWASTTKGRWITLLLQSYFVLFYFVAMDTTIQQLNLSDHLCSNLRCWQRGQTQLCWCSECVLGSGGRPWAAASGQHERSESQFFTQAPWIGSITDSALSLPGRRNGLRWQTAAVFLWEVLSFGVHGWGPD